MGRIAMATGLAVEQAVCLVVVPGLPPGELEDIHRGCSPWNERGLATRIHAQWRRCSEVELRQNFDGCRSPAAWLMTCWKN